MISWYPNEFPFWESNIGTGERRADAFITSMLWKDRTPDGMYVTAFYRTCSFFVVFAKVDGFMIIRRKMFRIPFCHITSTTLLSYESRYCLITGDLYCDSFILESSSGDGVKHIHSLLLCPSSWVSSRPCLFELLWQPQPYITRQRAT